MFLETTTLSHSRKTPIVGHTTCGSGEDKKLLASALAPVSAALTSASPEAPERPSALLETEASSVRSMGKDGRSYWPSSARPPRRIASPSGHRSPQEPALKKRLLRLVDEQ
jgi:hypothetical protein